MVNQFTHIITWFNYLSMIRNLVSVYMIMLDVWRYQCTGNYVSSALDIVIERFVKLLSVKIVLLDKVY